MCLIAACHKVHEVNDLNVNPVSIVMEAVSVFDTATRQAGQWKNRHSLPENFLVSS
jgi:hypothetical protein